jgi:peptidoglycan/xylan/chitin deacetylase (PgdA/CDA1 family)
MSRKSTKLMQAALTTLHYTGLGALLAPLTRGKGIIFTLHNVRPEPPERFEPNRILKVTPEFLETAIETVQKAGYDIVSLDEAARRLKDERAARPFACFTFDDGYRDNRDYAYPIFKARGLPFAIYVPSAYADGEGDLWWFVLEAAIRKVDRLDIVLDGALRIFDTGTPEAKERAFSEIYWPLRARPERELRDTVRRIAEVAGYDSSKLCRDLIMDWDELRALAADPLVTIGAHTRHHYAIAKLPEEDARAEITESVKRIERELGRPCLHFSFPYGDACSAAERDFEIVRSAGLETAVTTHKDVLRARNREAMTALPRVSLNGDFQKAHYVEIMMTGLPFVLFDTAKVFFAKLKKLRGNRQAIGGLTPAATRPGAASI